MVEIYNYPINVNIPKVAFYGNPVISKPIKPTLSDKFVACPIIDQYLDKKSLELEAKQNVRIQELLGAYNLPVKINEKAIEQLKNGHLKNTRELAVKLYSALPEELKKDVNLKQLQDASLLHDIGKVLIPDNILNKKGRLDQQEREIMELHSELGYKLLKNKFLDEETLNLIRNHHQNSKKTGYPSVSEKYDHSMAAQILSAADKYSALTEKRSYKESFDRQKALKILKNDETILPEIYSALEKAV